MIPEEALYKEILDNLDEGICIVDTQSKITFWNRGAGKITGYKASEVIGSSCADNILFHVDDQGTAPYLGACPLSHAMADGKSRKAGVYLKHKDGRHIPVMIYVAAIKDYREKAIGAYEVFIPSSDGIEAHSLEDLQRAAFLDPLTGLANRRYIDLKLRASFEEMRRHAIPLGVIFADIDHFKKVNDLIGHQGGDQVLKMVAQTIQKNVRSYDLAGRWGGEEFLIIAQHFKTDDFSRLANKLRMLVEKRVLTFEDNKIGITITLGATLAKPDDSIESLIRRADQLLYEGKNAGRNRVITDI